ncbi:hypothetical protein CEUSTIGMA_g5130.t1 [Chlamydomonas eustigma]|uniref:GLTSCR protein conserved domain-containing protein n=1 Tax=Chlamydomonas eustigma TaxID=1157962 RepID=A0A250X3N6_9CHLO|nr:hypothetical protein CEUSTIGMA_g5130.t1 [Chlamydomonas eustigma]|eukprot:GAX77687.1 hypothetical protein CEUSTIGMA_g5130.t1 [Chlamydomonas eustigma]
MQAPPNGPGSQPTVQPKVAPATQAEAQRYAQKRQNNLLIEDCKRVCGVDVSRPFSNLQDAIDKLLPFHILGAMDSRGGTIEENLDQNEEDMLCTRKQLMEDVLLRKTIEMSRQCHQHHERVRALEDRDGTSKIKRSHGEGVYVLEKLMLEDARARQGRAALAGIPGAAAASDDDDHDVLPDAEDAAGTTATGAAPAPSSQHISVKAEPGLAGLVAATSVKQQACDISTGLGPGPGTLNPTVSNSASQPQNAVKQEQSQLLTASPSVAVGSEPHVSREKADVPSVNLDVEKKPKVDVFGGGILLDAEVDGFEELTEDDD